MGIEESPTITLRRLVEEWRERRRLLRKGVYQQPENKRILFARADELQTCIEGAEAVLGLFPVDDEGWASDRY